MVIARVVEGVDVAAGPAGAAFQVVGVDLVVGSVGHPHGGPVGPQPPGTVIARVVEGVDVAVGPAGAAFEVVGVDLFVQPVRYPDSGAVGPQAVGVAVPGADERVDVLAGVGGHGGQVVREQAVAAHIGHPHGGAVRPHRPGRAVVGGQFFEIGKYPPAGSIGRGPVDGDGVDVLCCAVGGFNRDGDRVGPLGQAHLVARSAAIGVGGADGHRRAGVAGGGDDGG